MRKFNLFAMAMVAVAVFFSACSTEEIAPEGINQDVKDGLSSLGFDVSDLTKETVTRPDGTTEKVYVLEGDIMLNDDEMVNMLSSAQELPIFEQYRTTNLVSGNNRTISIIGYTGSGYALTSTMQTGLTWAVNNYNNLNLKISFSRSQSASTSADMVVYNNGQSGGGGSAGFPSGGNPYKWIQINAGTSSYGNNVNEHVIGHEMGHCIGFRHTDYFNRSLSCGSGGNEGSSGVGAIHIPGTPTGNDTNSLMRACFSSNEDGEFGSNDVTALQYLY